MPFPAAPEVEPSDKKLRICVVYSRSPLPMRRADQMTVAHLLAFLHARGHSVDLHHVDAGASVSQDDRNWLRAHTHEASAYKVTLWTIVSGLSGLFTKFLPLQVALFSHRKQAREVRRKVQLNGYDILYTYYFRSAEITRDLGFPTGTPTEERSGRPASFLAFQLSQTLNASRIAKNAPNLAIKILYEIERRLVARYEARIWRHFTKSILIGKSDVEQIRAACATWGQPSIDNFFYGAHGTDVKRFKPRNDIAVKRDHLVFSGVMRTPTNVQAAQWFARNVWPLILKERPQATWSIVGREPTREVLALGSLPGVNVTGAVDHPADLIAEASVCINPMQAGGGMQNKLIEYLASGKAVVATSVANEGINAPAEAIIIADEPTDFAAAVVALLADSDKAEKQGRCARAYALAEWTWESHFLKLEREFFAAIR